MKMTFERKIEQLEVKCKCLDNLREMNDKMVIFSFSFNISGTAGLSFIESLTSFVVGRGDTYN